MLKTLNFEFRRDVHYVQYLPHLRRTCTYKCSSTLLGKYKAFKVKAYLDDADARLLFHHDAHDSCKIYLYNFS